MTKPASPGAVAHRVTRLDEAAAHLLAALDSGATLTAPQRDLLDVLAASIADAARTPRPTSVPDAPVEGCEECEARGALCVECAADALDLTA